MNRLICTVGLPRSGKTTWARDQGFPIVNPDSIRLALHGKVFETLAEKFVWAIAHVMVRALFLAGHDTVIIDATNTTKKRRDEWQSKDWETRFMLFNADDFECKKRAKDSGRDDLIDVIDRMWMQRESLTGDESVYRDYDLKSLPWIGVDLDGTLAYYDGWQGPDYIGAPIKTMVERIEQWIAEGKRVKIFTARVCNGRKYISVIQDWLVEAGLPRLEVTNVKDFYMTELWDDRCVNVEKNMGFEL